MMGLIKKKTFKVIVYDDDTDSYFIEDRLGRYGVRDVDVILESEEDVAVTVCQVCGTETPVGRNSRCPIGKCIIAAAEWEATERRIQRG